MFTDHKLRVTAFQKTPPMKSDKQQRHLSLKSEYLTDILYFRREENLIAHCLSKTENSMTIDVYELPALIEQKECDT